jgi:hypothetical protein
MIAAAGWQQACRRDDANGAWSLLHAARTKEALTAVCLGVATIKARAASSFRQQSLVYESTNQRNGLVGPFFFLTFFSSCGKMSAIEAETPARLQRFRALGPRTVVVQ